MSTEILEDLKNAVLTYDKEKAASLARKAVEEKIDPLEALDVLQVTIRQVGDGFGRGELWLPDLIGAAEAMVSATPILEEEIRKTGSKRESLGTVVIGTVNGDIHDIGKTMVATLLIAEGFTVHDIGINVPVGTFVEAVDKHKADIIAMSALMTTTAPEQRMVIAALKEKGIREKVKIMIGGGAITQEFADEIGADGYDPTAPGAAKLARNLVRK